MEKAALKALHPDWTEAQIAAEWRRSYLHVGQKSLFFVFHPPNQSAWFPLYGHGISREHGLVPYSFTSYTKTKKLDRRGKMRIFNHEIHEIHENKIVSIRLFQLTQRVSPKRVVESTRLVSGKGSRMLMLCLGCGIPALGI